MPVGVCIQSGFFYRPLTFLGLLSARGITFKFFYYKCVSSCARSYQMCSLAILGVEHHLVFSLGAFSLMMLQIEVQKYELPVNCTMEGWLHVNLSRKDGVSHWRSGVSPLDHKEVCSSTSCSNSSLVMCSIDMHITVSFVSWLRLQRQTSFNMHERKGE